MEWSQGVNLNCIVRQDVGREERFTVRDVIYGHSCNAPYQNSYTRNVIVDVC